jgi:hypothetical protein
MSVPGAKKLKLAGAKKLKLPKGYMIDSPAEVEHSPMASEQRWHAEIHKLSKLESGMTLIDRAVKTASQMDGWMTEIRQTHVFLRLLPHAVAYEVYYRENKHMAQWESDWEEYLEANPNLKGTRLKHIWKTWQAIARGGGLGYYSLFERGVRFGAVCDWLRYSVLAHDRRFKKGWSNDHVVASVMATLFEQISPRKKFFKSLSTKKLQTLLDQRRHEASEVH